MIRVGTIGREQVFLARNGAMFSRTKFASGNISKLHSFGAYCQRYSVNGAADYVIAAGGTIADAMDAA